MTDKQPFEWKGVLFGWSRHRAASTANLLLSSQSYWFLVRETGSGAWESWFEFKGGHTAPCVMATRDLSLEGSVIALKDFFQASLKNLEQFEIAKDPRT